MGTFKHHVSDTDSSNKGSKWFVERSLKVSKCDEGRLRWTSAGVRDEKEAG